VTLAALATLVTLLAAPAPLGNPEGLAGAQIPATPEPPENPVRTANPANPENPVNLKNPGNPENPANPENPNEWTVSAGTGWGVPILGSATGHRYVFPSIAWSRVLTGPRGRGVFRGRFAWGIEVLPFFVQYHPVRSYGVGVSPLLWRWSFETRGRFAPFVEMGGGGLWTDADVPGETTRANYTAHVTGAVRVLRGGARGALVGYRFDHISNGNRVQPNPGVNAHVLVIGWTLPAPGR
jgi:Lipid A 3-O-deacylase (PagL)